MSRTGLRVRPAAEGDLPALVALTAELREVLLPVDNGLRPTSPVGRAQLEQRLREALASAERELVLVVGDGDEPLGMALFSFCDANALFPSPALHMSHVVVDDRHRRRGAGRALVAAAAACAEERGVEQVVVSVRPGSREANRFFARLGFAPLAVRRTASVGTLRRRLAHSDVAPAGVLRRRTRGARSVAAIPPQPSPPVPAPPAPES